MKVVIDISDNEYCTIKEMNLTLHTEMLKGSIKDWENASAILNLLESVKSGTVLKQCNTCEYYEGVHNAQGHAPCSLWKCGGVLWNDYCSNHMEYKKNEIDD